MTFDTALMWFRRDLRLTDNAALFHSLKHARRVYCVFVFDRVILDLLRVDADDGQRTDRRVDFIHGAITELQQALRDAGGDLIVRHGNAADEVVRLAAELGVDAVFANTDYEPYARVRDERVTKSLATAGRRFESFKDQVIFERDEVLTGGGRAFSVFTPYKNAWLKKVNSFFLGAYPVEKYLDRLAPPAFASTMPSLEDLGFASTDLRSLGFVPGARSAAAAFADFQSRVDDYMRARDFPAVKGVSYLSVHLRFGTLSVRELARFAHARSAASDGAATWLSELIWRDFYQMVLWFHPRVVEQSFKAEYDRIVWVDDDVLFEAWCAGRTGYPLVDAAMAQINQTGFMHNRLRMVVASFLTKDLGIDWRRGEAYFARQLNDFDLAANNGGWQWAASTGCDAQPYFRIFNPVTQSERFDPDGKFIRRYLPQLADLSAKEIHAPWRLPPLRQKQAGCVIGRDYPAPIVDHAQARAATLARYAVVK